MNSTRFDRSRPFWTAFETVGPFWHWEMMPILVKWTRYMYENGNICGSNMPQCTILGYLLYLNCLTWYILTFSGKKTQIGTCINDVYWGTCVCVLKLFPIFVTHFCDIFVVNGHMWYVPAWASLSESIKKVVNCYWDIFRFYDQLEVGWTIWHTSLLYMRHFRDRKLSVPC